MQRISSVLRWATAAAVLTVLLLLAWQCVDIYVDGNAPENLDANGVHLVSVYRMEDVALRMRSLVVPLAGCALLAGITFILHAVHPDLRKARHSITPENQLRLQKARIADIPAKAIKEEHRRLGIQITAGIMVVCCAAMCLTYLVQREHFASWDLETVMGNMMLHVAPWVCIAFAVAVIAAELCKASVVREVNILKGAPSEKKSDGAAQKGSHVNLLRTVLYVAAIVFIVLGVMNGGLHDVLVKAINICTECIGLG